MARQPAHRAIRHRCIAHWRKLARTSGLDEDAVAHLVIDMARNVLEHNDSAWNALDPDQRTIVRTAVARNAERLQ